MPLRPCLGFGTERCRKLANGDRCPDHKRQYEAARRPNRPSARQRGYDTEHDKLRQRLLPAAYGTLCPRCGRPMLYGQELDLGHPEGRARATTPGSRADHIEHARCNRRAGAS